MRFVTATAALICLAAFDSARADIGELHHYRGDWMIEQNRAHLGVTRLGDGDDCLELRLAYRRYNCPRWTRETWIMRYHTSTNTYTATIKSRTTEEATGRWDTATKTMTWTIVPPKETDSPVTKPRGKRHISHAFEPRKLTWGSAYVSPNGRESRNKPMTWDILVRHDEPTP